MSKVHATQVRTFIQTVAVALALVALIILAVLPGTEGAPPPSSSGKRYRIHSSVQCPIPGYREPPGPGGTLVSRGPFLDHPLSTLKGSHQRKLIEDQGLILNILNAAQQGSTAKPVSLRWSTFLAKLSQGLVDRCALIRYSGLQQGQQANPVLQKSVFTSALTKPDLQFGGDDTVKLPLAHAVYWVRIPSNKNAEVSTGSIQRNLSDILDGDRHLIAIGKGFLVKGSRRGGASDGGSEGDSNVIEVTSLYTFEDKDLKGPKNLDLAGSLSHATHAGCGWIQFPTTGTAPDSREESPLEDSVLGPGFEAYMVCSFSSSLPHIAALGNYLRDDPQATVFTFQHPASEKTISEIEGCLTAYQCFTGISQLYEEIDENSNGKKLASDDECSDKVSECLGERRPFSAAAKEKPGAPSTLAVDEPNFALVSKLIECKIQEKLCQNLALGGSTSSFGCVESLLHNVCP